MPYENYDRQKYVSLLAFWVQTCGLVGTYFSLDQGRQYIQRYSCDGTSENAVLEAHNQNDASQNGVLQPFFPAMCFMRLGVSCYLTALFFRQPTIFCTVPERKTSPPSPLQPNFWSLCAFLNLFFT
jgi:hypothetical protein